MAWTVFRLWRLLCVLGLVLAGSATTVRISAQSAPTEVPTIASEFPTGITAEALVESTLPDIPAGPSTLRLDRIQLGAGWQSGILTSDGPSLIAVEDGEITIVDELGIRGVYPSGTQLVVPMGAQYSLSNDSSASTTYLNLTLVPSSSVLNPGATPSAGSNMIMATPIAGEVSVTHLLQAELAVDPPSPVRLFVLRLTWEPGAELPGQTLGWPAGFVGVEGDLTVAGPSGIEGQIRPGDAVMFPPDLQNRARNAGSEPVVTLFAGMAAGDQPLINWINEPPQPKSTTESSSDATSSGNSSGDATGTPNAAVSGVPMFRGNAARTGEMNGSGPEGAPVLRWQVKVGTSARSSVITSEDSVFIRGSNGYWSAFEAATGNSLWRASEDSYAYSTAAVANEVLIVGGRLGKLSALDLRSGERQWELDTQLASPITSPAIVGDTAYFAAYSGSVGGVDIETGEMIWLADLDNAKILGSPAVAGDWVYIQRGQASSDPSAAVVALDAKTGAERWRSHIDSAGAITPAVANGRVFTISGMGIVLELDAETGAELWRFELGAAGVSSPAVSGNQVYALDAGGILHAIRVDTGAELWRFDTGGKFGSSPAVAGNVVYVSADSGLLYALDSTSGLELWRYETNELNPGTSTIMISSPTVDGGIVYVGSGDGYFYAIGGTSGDLAVTPTPVPIAAGSTATVAIDGAELRAAPSTAGVVIAELPVGTIIKVVGPSEERGGKIWWWVEVTDSGTSGYISAEFLSTS